MLRRKKALLIGLMILTTMISFSAFGQEENVSLKDKRITIQMVEKPLFTIFTRLIQKYDVAIGFEESVLDRDHRHYYFEPNVATEALKMEFSGDKEILPSVPKFNEHLITVNFKNARLEEVMDAIVKQMTHYDWEFSDGVVNIFPIEGRDARLKKLLDVKVRVFAVGMGATVGSIQAQLMLFLPEFKAFLVENSLEGSTAGPYSVFEERILPYGMGFSDLTFKELLNAITKSKRGGWILQIKTRGDNPSKEFIEIFI